MALRYLLDTNVLSEWVKPQPHAGVMQAMQRHEAECAIAATTLQELAFGVARLPQGQRRAALETWLSGCAHRFPILPFDAKAAWWLGLERARLAAIGRALPHADGEIAACAVAHELILVTRNVKDFEGLQGLGLVNWHAVPKL